MIISASIDVTKIDKSKLKAGREKNGKVPMYLDLTLLENRQGTDQYGNDGMVIQSATKQERAAGKRGAILGNYKIIGVRPEAPEKPEIEEPDDGDVPF